MCNGNSVLEAIQVSYDISDPKTYKREINGLVEAARKTRAKRLLLLTDHDYRDVNASDFNIAVRPVYEYFLDN